MNNYTKMDAKKFAAKLEAGQYDTLTGARRGIGKSSMSEADKKKCSKLADAHFGDNSPAPEPEKKGKAAASPPVSISDTYATVSVTREAIEGLARAKVADSSIDVRTAVQTGANILGMSLRKLYDAIASADTPMRSPHVNGIATTPAASSDADTDEDAHLTDE